MKSAAYIIGPVQTLKNTVVEVSDSIAAIRFGAAEVDESLRKIAALNGSIANVLYHIETLLLNHKHALDRSGSYPPLEQRPDNGQLTVLQTLNLEVAACRHTADTILDTTVPEMRAKAPNLFLKAVVVCSREFRMNKYAAEVVSATQISRLVMGHLEALRVLHRALQVQLALTGPRQVGGEFEPATCIDQMRESIESLRREQEAPKIGEIPQFKADFAHLLKWADWFLTLTSAELLKRAEEESTEPTMHANAPPAHLLPPQQIVSNEVVDLDVEIIQKLEARATSKQWAEAVEVRATEARNSAELSPPDNDWFFDSIRGRLGLAYATLYAGKNDDAGELFHTLHDELTAQGVDKLSSADKDTFFSCHQGLAEFYVRIGDLNEAEEQGRAAAFGRRNNYGKTDHRTCESLYILAAVLELKGEKAEAAVLRDMIPRESRGTFRPEVQSLYKGEPVGNRRPAILRDGLIAYIKERARAMSNEDRVNTLALCYKDNGEGVFVPVSGLEALTAAVKFGKDVDVFNIVEGFRIDRPGLDGFGCGLDAEERIFKPVSVTGLEIEQADLIAEAVKRGDNEVGRGILSVLIDKYWDILTEKSKERLNTVYFRKGGLYNLVDEIRWTLK